jgi:uroporphyrinogen-III synthase
MRRLVILRPEPGASATFDKAIALGLDPFKLPLFEIERLDWSPPVSLSEFDGILITSANAVREAGEGLEQLKSLPVFAVGPATAKAAYDAGFKIAKIGRGNVATLLRNIDPDLKLLHLAGEDRIDPRRVWQKITVLPVYRARKVENIDASAVQGAVVLVHSPRGGARLAEVVTDRSRVSIAALSKAVAAACGEGWRDVSAVARPRDSALLALAARLCEKSVE